MKGRWVLAGFALGALTTALVVGPFMGPSFATAGTRLDRKAFHAALDTVLDRYVDPVDRAALLSRGLKHMVAGLDAHSHYLTAPERKALRARARGGRTGLWVAVRDGKRPQDRRLEVVAVGPGSPAQRAGIAPGDHILDIDGHAVAFLLSQADAEALLSGTKGETVALAVQSPGETSPRSVALTLDGTLRQPVRGSLVDDDGGHVAIIEIDAFRTDTGARFRKTLRELERRAGRAGLKGLVIDLCGNPGGEVDEALVVADMFVASGVLTRTRGRGGQILREEQAHGNGTNGTTPIVVLQNRHTASAAELLSAALQAHGRAKVVGERSYGKGTVQEVIGMEDGSRLTLTIARYFSPKDAVIDGVGVTPDIAIAVTSNSDAPLRAALQALRGDAPARKEAD